MKMTVSFCNTYRLLLLCVLGVCLSACLEDFAPPSQIENLRILSIRAEPPEVSPGDTVRVDGLVANPTGTTLPPTLLWLTCIPDPFDGVDACLEGEGLNFADIGVSEIDVEIPADLVLFPEGDPNATSTMLLTLVACESFDPEECINCEGDVCTFGSEGVEAEVALKRVTISARPEEVKNLNPVIEEVSFALPGSASFTAIPEEGLTLPPGVCEGFTLRAKTTEESQEVFEEIQFGKPVPITETLLTSFFTTQGEVGADRIFNGVGDGVAPGVADVDFLLATPSSDTINLFFVVRDDRGGVDFASRTLTLDSSCGAP